MAADAGSSSQQGERVQQPAVAKIQRRSIPSELNGVTGFTQEGALLS